jgi:hypothetical protein
VGKVVVLVALLAARASADDHVRPWLAAEARPDATNLAAGTEGSIDLSGGSVFTRFVTSPVVTEAGAIGHYFRSSPTQAFSVEAVEQLEVAFDHTTPQLGLLAIGVRRLGGQSLGGIGAFNFERISAGLALASRGSTLATGMGADVDVGTLSFCGHGLDLHVDGYFFGRPDASGVDAVVAVGFGYIFSPRHGARRPRPIVEAAPVTPLPPPVPKGPPCAKRAELEAALVAQRQRSIAACNAARDDTSRVDDCNREWSASLALRTRLDACIAGEDPDAR